MCVLDALRYDAFKPWPREVNMRPENTSKTHALYERAKTRIPGGTQLLSKRPEMFAPECWPAYFRAARGCEVWDLDGRHYFDFSHNGVGACLLGYAHPEVTRAVQDAVARGSMCSLNPPEEVALAERLCAIHPWAEQARFTRAGGEACAVAVRIVRAATGRDRVAVCGYHGWHDWYLAANLGDSDALRGHLLPGLDPTGVPDALRGTAVAFAHGGIPKFDAMLDAHGDRLAAVIMEPCRHRDPAPGFLEHVRERTRRAGALLVFDEITIGWRRCFGGAHLLLGVAPDIAVFAKALGNGHPVGAVIGTAAAMKGAHASFISSTSWTESVGPVAALATLEAMERERPWEHVAGIGERVQAAWRESANRHALPLDVPDSHPCFAHFRFDHPLANALRTLFTQRMLHHGFLAGPAFYPTLAHTEDDVRRYAEAVDTVFAEMARALAEDGIDFALEGPPAHEGFRRLL